MSNTAKVKNVKTGKLLRPWLNSHKPGSMYWRVELYKNGESKKFYLHRLVAQAFCPLPKGYSTNELQVHHKIGPNWNKSWEIEWRKPEEHGNKSPDWDSWHAEYEAYYKDHPPHVPF